MRTKMNPRWKIVALFVGGLALLVSFYIDASVQAWLAQHQSPELKWFMRRVSRVGDWEAHIILGLSFLAVAFWRGNKRWTRILAAMILAFALAGTVSRVIKISTGRARPDVKTETRWNAFQTSSRYNAFPSGHTATSAAFFATLALTTRWIATVSLIIPLLIGFSRMYISAHHLSDVVGALIVGLVTAFIMVRWIPPSDRAPQSETQD